MEQWLPGLGGERNREVLVQRYNISVIEDEKNSPDLLYSMQPIVNNTVLYT